MRTCRGSSLRAGAVVLFALFLFAGPVSAATVTLENATFAAPGEERVINLILDEAPDGLVGYRMNLAIDDPRVARITAVSFPAWASMHSANGLEGGTDVRIAGLDLMDKTKAGATAIPLASVTIRGIINASTTIRISQDSIEADKGQQMTYTLNHANISIGTFSSGSAGAPVISFTGTSHSGDGPLTVAFTDTSANNPTMWSWSFGDGSYSTLQNPTHTFIPAGTYTVSLIASNPHGSSSTTEPGYITVISAPPVPDFSALPLSGTAPLTVEFTDLSMKNPEEWAWYFGDENYSAPWSSNEPWKQMSAGIGEHRNGHSSVATMDGGILLMGGFNGFDYWNDVWKSTDYGATWSRINPSTTWPPRSDPCSIVMPDSSIIMMGGAAGNVLYNDVWRSTDNGTVWTQMTPSAGWSARQDPSCVALQDGSIILTGGYEISTFTYKNDVWKSTDSGATWSMVTPNAGWEKRFLHSSVVMPDGSIVLMGGALNHNGGILTDVWRSTDSGATWTQMTPSAGWTGLYYNKCVTLKDGSIILIDGYKTDTNKNDIWKSTDYGASWTRMSPGPEWVDRSIGSSVRMDDGSIVLIGGYRSSSATLFSDVWRFTPPSSFAQNPSHTYTRPGTYSVTLVGSNYYGNNIASKTNFITVTAPPAPIVTGIVPSAGVNTTTVSITNLAGIKFTNGVTVKLNRTGFPDINGVGISVISPTQISCTFNLTSKSAGLYNVVVVDGNGQSGVLPEGFLVTDPLAGPAPLAAFTANRTEGDWPLTVKFTDTTTNSPASWSWDFGDGSTSAEQNPAHKFQAAGTYTVNLTTANTAGSNKTVKNAYITVIEPVQKSNTFTVPSIQITNTGTITINTTNATANGKVVNLTSGTGFWDRVGVTLTDPPALDGTGKNWTGTVDSVIAVTKPVTAPIASAGTPSVQIALNLSAMPPGEASSITQTLTKYPDATAQSSFSLAASGDGKQIDDIAYSLNVVKFNIANHGDGGIIQSATLTMTVSPAWVAAHGGLSKIVILRRGEDGTTQILTPVLTGTDATGNYILTVFSPNGLSTFSLASVSAISTGSGGSTTGYSSTTSGDSGGGGTPAGSLSSTSTVKRAQPDPGAGPWTSLHVNGPTHITQVEIQTSQAMKDLLVITEKPDSLPQGIPSPGMPVYEFHKVNLYHATESDVNRAVIGFTVSESWLKEQKMSEGDIQLIRFHNNAWERLDTEYAGRKDGNFVYKATSGGFSYFATVLVKGATLVPAQEVAPTAPAVTASPRVTVPAALHAVTPRAPETMAVPQVPVTPPQPSPVPLFVFGIAAIVVLSVSVVFVRRWWIRRQNPALFRDLE